MALISCPGCAKEISDKADSCPICGCPVNKTGIAITEATKTDEKSPKDVAMGARFLVGIFIVLIIIVGACNRSKKPAPTRSIKAGIADFKTAIPILRQNPMETKERDSRIDYSWSHIVLSGEKNTVVIYDNDKNGTVDSLLFIFSLSNNETANLASIALGYKLLEVAAGSQQSNLPKKFTTWLLANVGKGKKGVETSFDGLRVGLSSSLASNGVVAFLTIGAQSDHHAK
mgnify:CR=1 FL=1